MKFVALSKEKVMQVTQQEFVNTYKQAEQRATTCAQGKAFTVEDRLLLTAQRNALQLSSSKAAWTVAANHQDAGVAYSRFGFWESQINSGEIRTAPPATGQSASKPTGSLKVTRADAQAVMTQVVGDILKAGMTTEESYILFNKAFDYHKNEQKIYLKTNRIVEELQIGDLTKPQMIEALDRAKTFL
jgi:hypothetical protein